MRLYIKDLLKEVRPIMQDCDAVCLENIPQN